MKKITVLLISLLLITTGCTKSFKDEKTNQVYTQNILCKPESEELKEIYNDNKETTKVDIEKLSKCEDFKINEGKYEGLWNAIFVKPLAWIIIKLGNLVKNYGVSIMLIGIILRLIMLPFTKKSMDMNENMQKAKPELDKIERKYRNKEDQQSLMMKSQEMMMVYKKYNINPASSCLVMFIQLPLLFAFLEAIQRIPAIFEEKLFGFHLGTTPWQGLAAHQYQYLIIIVLIALTTYFSFKQTSNASLGEAEQKQMLLMNKIMVVFITITAFRLPTALAFYWVISNGFVLVQSLVMKLIKKNKEK